MSDEIFDNDPQVYWSPRRLNNIKVEEEIFDYTTQAGNHTRNIMGKDLSAAELNDARHDDYSGGAGTHEDFNDK